jgi:hypothetical protein
VTPNRPFSITTARGGDRAPRPENRFALDYSRAAGTLPARPCPIVDIHTHLNGPRALSIFSRAMDWFGIERTFTMVRLSEAQTTLDALGSRVGFIAFPDFRAPDRREAFTGGFLRDIREFRERFGSRMIKLWNAPRMYDFFPGDAGKDLIAFDSEWRMRHVELAQKLGMGVMVHVADPDTWFRAKYADAGVYPPKIVHYEGLERLMERFEGPFLAAHMGGFPEDLDFLDGLLTRHPNLSLDTSATKWVVRELSKHPRERVRAFFAKWRTRILFGSDIVTTDEHLESNPAFPPALGKAPAPGFNTSPPAAPRHPMADLAESEEGASDLYASRYFTLRMLFETEYQGESPIADPDLRMVDPSVTDPLAAPVVRGFALSADALRDLYRENAQRFFSRVERGRSAFPDEHAR